MPTPSADSGHPKGWWIDNVAKVPRTHLASEMRQNLCQLASETHVLCRAGVLIGLRETDDKRDTKGEERFVTLPVA